MPGVQAVIDDFDAGSLSYDKAIAGIQYALEDIGADDFTADQVRSDVQQWMDSILFSSAKPQRLGFQKPTR